jgi:hypothetical protein
MLAVTQSARHGDLAQRMNQELDVLAVTADQIKWIVN